MGKVWGTIERKSENNKMWEKFVEPLKGRAKTIRCGKVCGTIERKVRRDKKIRLAKYALVLSFKKSLHSPSAFRSGPFTKVLSWSHAETLLFAQHFFCLFIYLYLYLYIYKIGYFLRGCRNTLQRSNAYSMISLQSTAATRGSWSFNDTKLHKKFLFLFYDYE